jgi:hypothetical protein
MSTEPPSSAIGCVSRPRATMANAREGAAFSVNVNSRILIHVGDRYGRPPVFAHPSVCDEPLYCPGFRIGGGQGMIGEPKFWYGGMLQQAAAGRFLGYGGMRQTGVGDFTYAFTHHARARRGLETSIANSQSMSGANRLAFLRRQKVARHDKRFRMQLPVNLSWVGGPHIKTLVGVSQGYARLCSPAFRVRHSYHLNGRWP